MRHSFSIFMPMLLHHRPFLCALGTFGNELRDPDRRQCQNLDRGRFATLGGGPRGKGRTDRGGRLER